MPCSSQPVEKSPFNPIRTNLTEIQMRAEDTIGYQGRRNPNPESVQGANDSRCLLRPRYMSIALFIEIFRGDQAMNKSVFPPSKANLVLMYRPRRVGWLDWPGRKKPKPIPNQGPGVKHT